MREREREREREAGGKFKSSHYTNKYTNTSLPFAGHYEQLTLIWCVARVTESI